MLALGAHYLRALDAAGITVDDAAGLVEFRLSASADQFVTIAKLRAVRRMWARMLELSGASEDHRNMSLHAVTSRPMMTKHDPWVNMLRTCVAAFAAGVGGADAVTVLPFDARLGLPDAFARRIARNTSTLLVEESHVAKVADPAGGAFAVEKLTDDLAVAGWEELGRIESAGGVTDALDDGSLRARIDEVVAERDRQIAKRTRPLTGLTEFPNLHETLPERKPYAEGALPVRPYGEPFETLRDEPAETKVFLATMGTIAAHTARASFATNLFAAGGIDVVNAGRHDDVGGRAEGLPGTGRRPVRRLPGRRRQGVRRVGRRPREGAARGRCRMGRARRPPRRGRRDRRHLRHGCGRARVPAADEGEVSCPSGAISADPRELRRPAARGRGHREGARGGRDVGVAGGHRHPADLRPRAPRGPRRAGHLPGPRAVPPRALPDDVHHPALDHPPVRRLLDRRGVQRLLPPQPGGRPEGPLGRLRPRHPPRLRLRPPAREG